MAEEGLCKVIVDDSGAKRQWSVISVTTNNPAGFRDAGKTGTRSECAEFVRKAWAQNAARGA